MKENKQRLVTKTFAFGFRGRPLTCTVTGEDNIREAQALYDSSSDDTDDAWRAFAAAGYVADPEDEHQED